MIAFIMGWLINFATMAEQTSTTSSSGSTTTSSSGQTTTSGTGTQSGSGSSSTQTPQEKKSHPLIKQHAFV